MWAEGFTRFLTKEMSVIGLMSLNTNTLEQSSINQYVEIYTGVHNVLITNTSSSLVDGKNVRFNLKMQGIRKYKS